MHTKKYVEIVATPAEQDMYMFPTRVLGRGGGGGGGGVFYKR